MVRGPGCTASVVVTSGTPMKSVYRTSCAPAGTATCQVPSPGMATTWRLILKRLVTGTGIRYGPRFTETTSTPQPGGGVIGCG
ncbi:hypothetical protein V2I01_33895 [Micromonospora sp. BRA006-A]|nr:hypothetical protein [Micromonospora sp. BRA006-A]